MFLCVMKNIPQSGTLSPVLGHSTLPLYFSQRSSLKRHKKRAIKDELFWLKKDTIEFKNSKFFFTFFFFKFATVCSGFNDLHGNSSAETVFKLCSPNAHSFFTSGCKSGQLTGLLFYHLSPFEMLFPKKRQNAFCILQEAKRYCQSEHFDSQSH